jgi:hypothetical protein
MQVLLETLSPSHRRGPSHCFTHSYRARAGRNLLRTGSEDALEHLASIFERLNEGR